MEELWKLSKMDYRITDVAERAEYEKMVKRYRDEEERFNRNHLLYGDDHIEASRERSDQEKS